MIWIIGEYAERIENADELLDSFLENFHDESTQVQLQLVTAIVKLFLKRPKDTQEMVQKVLNLATQETDNPDLRDRGYIYWRLLSTDPEAAKAVVLGEKPLISESTTNLDESMLDQLVRHISSLASVYHKLPEGFVTKYKEVKKEKHRREQETDGESLLPQGEGGYSGGATANIFDLDSIDQSLPAVSSPSQARSGPVNVMDELDFLGTPSTPSVPQSTREIVLPSDRANGMQIAGAFSRRNGQVYLDATITNYGSVLISDFALQFNKNTFGLAPSQPQLGPIGPGQSGEVAIPVTAHPNMLNTGAPASNVLQIAIKNNTGVYYFQMNVPLQALFGENGELGRDDYLNLWKSISEEHFKDVYLPNPDLNAIQTKLRAHNLFYIAKRTVAPQEFLYFSARVNDNLLLLELGVSPQGARICTKAKNPEFIPFFEQAVASILSK
jgi:AP-1 complex subunit beta-1